MFLVVSVWHTVKPPALPPLYRDFLQTFSNVFLMLYRDYPPPIPKTCSSFDFTTRGPLPLDVFKFVHYEMLRVAKKAVDILLQSFLVIYNCFTEFVV